MDCRGASVPAPSSQSQSTMFPSRRRDCYSAAPPSPCSRCFNMGEEGMSVK